MSNPEVLEAKPHYSYVTRSLINLYNEGSLTNVQSIDIEPEYGYTARINYVTGDHRITYGNDLGLNPASATDLAKDKGHSKFMLRAIGINCPKGKEFLLPWWSDTIKTGQLQRGNDTMRTTNDAPIYVQESLGYPAYVKPVSGSKGLGVQRVDNEQELSSAFETLNNERSRVAVVEEAVLMPDYRVVVLDGELISAYERVPLTVVGDGESPVEKLISSLQTQFDKEGRDTQLEDRKQEIVNHLGKAGLSLGSVPRENEKVILAAISNLSAGGTSRDVTATINERWITLASFVAKNFNLRLCGLDLACQNIREAGSDYSVLEVNSSPGLDHYASSGSDQKKIVDRLYAQVLNALPSPA